MQPSHTAPALTRAHVARKAWPIILANASVPLLGLVDTAVIGEPSFRLVVTGTGPTLVTEDGTVCAPLRALAP